VFLCLRLIPTPPALSRGPVLRPLEVLPGKPVPRLHLVKLRGKPLGAPGGPATVPSGLWLFGIRYFFLEVQPLAHCRLPLLLLGDLPLEIDAEEILGAALCVPPVGPSSSAVRPRGIRTLYVLAIPVVNSGLCGSGVGSGWIRVLFFLVQSYLPSAYICKLWWHTFLVVLP